MMGPTGLDSSPQTMIPLLDFVSREPPYIRGTFLLSFSESEPYKEKQTFPVDRKPSIKIITKIIVNKLT